jgi:hypothetical protein
VGEVSTVAEKLREARALIAKGWTQDAEARNAAGADIQDVDPAFEDVEPVCWCAAGAIFWATGIDEYSTAADVLVAAIGERTRHFIPQWNDAPERTQAEVLQAFDRAIELAESQA